LNFKDECAYSSGALRRRCSHNLTLARISTGSTKSSDDATQWQWSLGEIVTALVPAGL
jgi:hypothetical protein